MRLALLQQADVLRDGSFKNVHIQKQNNKSKKPKRAQHTNRIINLLLSCSLCIVVNEYALDPKKLFYFLSCHVYLWVLGVDYYSDAPSQPPTNFPNF